MRKKPTSRFFRLCRAVRNLYHSFLLSFVFYKRSCLSHEISNDSVYLKLSFKRVFRYRFRESRTACVRMEERQDNITEGTPTSSTETLHFLDLVRQLSVDPMAGQGWEADAVKKLLVWIWWESDLNKPSPERNRQDIFILHSLLVTNVYHVDELLCPPKDSVVETALSRAVEKNDKELIIFLLKKGASLDVLIGPVLSIGKPALFASDRTCPMFAALILEHVKSPSRVPVNTVMYFPSWLFRYQLY